MPCTEFGAFAARHVARNIDDASMTHGPVGVVRGGGEARLYDGSDEGVGHAGPPRALPAMHADCGGAAALHRGVLRRNPVAVGVAAVQGRHLLHSLARHKAQARQHPPLEPHLLPPYRHGPFAPALCSFGEVPDATSNEPPACRTLAFHLQRVMALALLQCMSACTSVHGCERSATVCACLPGFAGNSLSLQNFHAQVGSYHSDGLIGRGRDRCRIGRVP